MDLLVLADSDGVVDMTLEAISRRTNVPMAEVQKYISELQQPDPTSRSKLEGGKRIVPIDSQRGWGWQIVNYNHYREIRDEEARRTYFRDYQRVRRKKVKSNYVKDINLTKVNESFQKFSSASASTSSSELQKGECEGKGKPKDAATVIAYARELGLPEADGHYYWDKWQAGGYVNAGKPIRDWKALIRSHKSAGYCPSQKKGFGASSFQKPKQIDPNQQRREDEYEQWQREKRAKKQ